MYFSCEEKYCRMCYIYLFTAIEILMIEKTDLLHKIQNIKKCRKDRRQRLLNHMHKLKTHLLICQISVIKQTSKLSDRAN